MNTGGPDKDSPDRVRVLDPAVSQQVAAGEVVDRPASVVKELVENALDAGASNIEVDIKDGGSELIAVTDDGRGMDREDARNAVLAHATSKIASVEDLESVATLGFRGEALPSIASVSSFELTTSTSEGAATGATKVSVEGGAEAQVSPSSRPRGTSVWAKRLFYNVPARREFLKSKRVERAAISETVTHLAIAHPTVAFKLTDDYREQLSLPKAKDLKERLAGIYGVQNVKAFKEVAHESFPYRITGYVALPSLTYTNRYSCQTVSVNGRWIRGSSITKAIDDAYRGTLPAGRYPPVVLSIEIDQRKVDVNVHPTKQIVRFSDDTGVRRAVTDAISLATGSIKGSKGSGPAAGGGKGEKDGRTTPRTDLMETNGAGAGAGQRPEGRSTGTSASPAGTGSSGSGGGSQGKLSGTDQARAARRSKQERENAEEIAEFQRQVADASKPLGDRKSQPASSGRIQAGPGSPDTPGSGQREGLPERGALPDPASSRVIGQFSLGYILLEEPGSLWIVDQHVAHERVLLDKLNASEDISVQQLLTPEIVELSATEAAEGRELLEELAVYGFEAEPFGPSSFRITGVISTLAERDIAGAFRRAMLVARGTGSSSYWLRSPASPQ